jgi:hypothetical protein
LALPIGIAIGLAALFFGGNHDNPATMPDKYDEPNYGQNTANLRGTMGAGGGQYTENQNLATLFGGRTGLQMVEETLAEFGTANNAPAWLKPMFNQLEGMFGESTTGNGVLSIGLGGSGKDCNNQQIVGVPDTNGQVYQYTQLDAALANFQTVYANGCEREAGPMSWDSYASPGSAPPPGYGSTSYQTHTEYYA